MPVRNDLDLGQRTTDVILIGDGIIGLSTALELDRQGVHCVVFGTERSGVASFAAAGLLAPSIGQVPPAARPFFEANMRLYPALLATLAEVDPTLSLVSGLVVVEGDAGGHAPAIPAPHLTSEEVQRLEPSLEAPRGAVVYPTDGAIDNVRLMRALRLTAERRPGIQLVAEAPVESIDVRPGQVVVSTESGHRVTAARAILGAGAWSPQIQGLPRPVPVFPLKGQMLALGVCRIRRAVVGNGVYLVPRGNETIIGSTSERAGFDVSTSPQAIEALRVAATTLCPALAASESARAWAGVRPATPDMLPILGPDPDHPELLYATGHSRNGILLAPATAKVLAELVAGDQPSFDLSGFGIARFEASPGATNLVPDV